jgi:hypothetical protein
MHRRTTKVERRDYPCWATIEPAPDIEGKWVAHCLEFDTLAQADDPETAVELLLESTSEIVLEDLRNGVDPLERRAPQDDEGWSLLRFITEKPDSTRSGTGNYREMWDEVKDKAARNLVVIAVQFFLGYQRSVASAHLDPEKAQQMFFQTRERNVAVGAV